MYLFFYLLATNFKQLRTLFCNVKIICAHSDREHADTKCTSYAGYLSESDADRFDGDMTGPRYDNPDSYCNGASRCAGFVINMENKEVTFKYSMTPIGYRPGFCMYIKTGKAPALGFITECGAVVGNSPVVMGLLRFLPGLTVCCLV